MSTTAAAHAVSIPDPSRRRLAAGLLVSLFLHGVLLALQFGVPGLRPGSGAPLTVSVAPPAPVAAVAPALLARGPVVAPARPDAVAPMPVAPALPPPQAAPAPRSGFTLVDPAKPAPMPTAPAPATAVQRPARRRQRPRRAPLPESLQSRVIAQDSHRESTFKVPLPDIEAGAEPAVAAEEAPAENQAGEDDVQARAQEGERLAQQRASEREAHLAAEEAALRAREAQEQEQAAARERELQQLAQERRLQEVEEQRERQRQQERMQQLAEQQRAEQQRVEQQVVEQQRAEQHRAEQQVVEQQRVEQQLVEQRRAERQRAEKELAAQQRIAQQAAEQQRAEQQRVEQQRVEQQLAEQRRADDALRRQAAEQERTRLAQQEAAQAAEAARRQADEGARQAREEQARQRARADGGGMDGMRAPGAGSGTLPPGALGSDIANRARELARGIDILKPLPQAMRPAEDAARGLRRALSETVRRDVPLRMYADSVRQKIERNAVPGTAQLAARDVRTDPLVSIIVRSDGSVEDVTILRSSGHPGLDEQVRNIVRLNARYSAFPPNIAAHYDVVELRRVWQFAGALRLVEEMR